MNHKHIHILTVKGAIVNTPCPVCRISLVPVIRWAKNFERAASLVNKERLTEASRTKHSSA